MPFKQDKAVLGELAKQYMEIAADPINAERKARIRQNNGLVPGRPTVWVDEVPWHEMDMDSHLCEDGTARQIEDFLRRALFRWEHFQLDMVAEARYRIPKAFSLEGIGVDVDEKTLAADAQNNIVSHCYGDQLDTEEKLEALHPPVVTAHPRLDDIQLEKAQELVGEVLSVELCGHGIYHAPWDTISMLRGVEPILLDMMDRPGFLHRTIARFTEFGLSQYRQMEAQGLLEADLSALHCTPPWVDGLPAPGYMDGAPRFQDVWFRGMAQIFSAVSPAMYEEFDLAYSKEFMGLCGLCYYGCCEPLDDKIHLFDAIPNMRKISISPWADIHRAAERMGGRYVLSFKPNPALVAGVLDEAAVERQITGAVEAALKHGCCMEIVLKDISTVSYRPRSLDAWAQITTRVLDRYY